MKKYLLALISLCFIVSCDKDDSAPLPPVPKVTFLDCLVNHKWVYDHPNIPTWEEWNVFDDGVMYYSNSTSFIYTFTNKDVKCRYVYNRDNGAFLIQTESLGTVEGVISKWDNYEFTWKTNDGSFSYSCLLETDTIDKGATFEPSYSKLISDATISNYSSHNTTIADVDASGKITAKSQGRTYIDVVTDKGTAVVEVYVAKHEPKIVTDYESKNGEYASLLGKDKSTIVEKLGTNAFYVTATDLWYSGADVNAKDYKYVIFSLDEPTSRAYSIGLYLNTNPDYEEIKEYLTAKYFVFEKGTNAQQLAFMDAEELANATMGITVDLVNGMITFVDLSYSYGGSGYGAKAATRSGAQSMFFSNPSAYIPNLNKVLK